MYCGVGVDSMPQDLQRFVSRLREVELEKKGIYKRTWLVAPSNSCRQVFCDFHNLEKWYPLQGERAHSLYFLYAH